MKSGRLWVRLRTLLPHLSAPPVGLRAGANGVPIADRAYPGPGFRPCRQDCCAPSPQSAGCGPRARQTSESRRPGRGRERESGGLERSGDRVIGSLGDLNVSDGPFGTTQQKLLPTRLPLAANPAGVLLSRCAPRSDTQARKLSRQLPRGQSLTLSIDTSPPRYRP